MIRDSKVCLQINGNEAAEVGNCIIQEGEEIISVMEHSSRQEVLESSAHMEEKSLEVWAVHPS